MRCPECREDNPEGAKFCSSCGSPLQAQCPKCGERNRPGARFCNECGAALSGKDGAERPAPQPSDTAEAADVQLVPEGERKLVTALFVDIINSTGLEQDLDPEDARAIIDPALKLMIEAVRRYDGHVVQSTGDGIFALFGAPVAHEDHPQRSLYTALRLNEEIRRFSERLRSEGRAPIQIRAGANTGEVVVRQIQTGDSQTEYTPIGHTVNLASRIQALANGGSIVISDWTRKLVDGYFALRPMGPAQLKGISEPVNVYEVVGLGPLRTRLEKSVGRGLSKFVGRSKEKRVFHAAAEKARAGEGQIVGVVAEPGVGKSRLFHEFKAEASPSWAVMEAFALSHGKGSAFLPIIELLHGYFGLAADDDQATRRQRVAAKLDKFDPALESARPFLNSLLELGGDNDRIAGMDAQLRRTRIIQAVVELLLSEAKREPLILIVEDLQWLDDESQAVLDLLVERMASARLLLLVNFRPEHASRWTAQPNYRQLRLHALDRNNAEEMLSAMLGAMPELAPLKQVIIETTAGTPFFMEETVRALLDDGSLARENGAIKLVRPISSLRIPPTVQAILAARIDRLRNDEKNLLQTLAVLGREFVLSLARAVSGMSEDELERLILNLQLGDFVYEQPSITDVEYIFKHALTQEVAYNSVLVERRKQLHGLVGQAMELLYSGSIDDHLPDLAHHFSRSANRPKAVEYLRRAGVQAASRGALTQAVQDFEGALDLLKTLPAGQRRDALELQVLNPLGTAYIAVRGYAAPEVGPVFQRARTLCDKIGEPQQQFLVVFGNFAWRIVRGEMDLALALAEEALAMAEKLDDPGIWMEALFLMGVVLFYRGDFARARGYYEKGLAAYDDRELTRLWALRVGEDAGVTHRCYLSLALWHLGYAEQALRLNEESVELARSIGHPFSLTYAEHHASWLRQLMRLPAETVAFGEAQMHNAAEQGFPLFRATGMTFAAAGRLLQGDSDQGLPGLVKGLDAYRATGAALALPQYLCLLAEGLGQTGRAFDATGLLEHALDLAERNNERCHEAELHRLKGEMTMSQGLGSNEAEAHMRRAMAVAKAQGSKAFELRAAISLARLYQHDARKDRAREVLAPLLPSFEEGLAMPDLMDARALLEAL